MRKPTTSFAPGTDGDQLLTTIIDQQICLMLHDGEKGKLDLAVGLSQSGGSDMCDYSLHNVRSRPAKVGNKLTTRDFGTVHAGVCSPPRFNEFSAVPNQRSVGAKATCAGSLSRYGRPIPNRVRVDPIPQFFTGGPSLCIIVTIYADKISREPVAITAAKTPAMVRPVRRSLQTTFEGLTVIVTECACYARCEPSLVHITKSMIQLQLETAVHASDYVFQ